MQIQKAATDRVIRPRDAARFFGIEEQSKPLGRLGHSTHRLVAGKLFKNFLLAPGMVLSLAQPRMELEAEEIIRLKCFVERCVRSYPKIIASRR